MAIRCGADALGLVSEMPSGPGVILEARIAEIAAQVPPPVATFLLTSRQRADEVVAQLRRCRTNTVQLCDRLHTGCYGDIRAALPGIAIVQVIHVVDARALEAAAAMAPHVDAVLLDSGRPDQAVKELGGTGRTHDWQLSRRICAATRTPVFLAGGLRPENVGEAIAQVRPFGVDVCSGVRTRGHLDEAKLAAFIGAVREAAA